MVTTVRGQLGPVSGTVDYDGKDVRTVKADVRIDVNGITTQNAKRDGHLRSDDFFDAANHPFITFKSKRVEPGADGSFKLVGDLTIRGNTKEVALDVEGPTPPIKGMRWGQAAESLAWAVPFFIQPLAAVFYPVSVLPAWLQPAAMTSAPLSLLSRVDFPALV